jgi:hypothetical protein
MVICWVRLPNDKPRQMTKFNNIYIYREREWERERFDAAWIRSGWKWITDHDITSWTSL